MSVDTDEDRPSPTAEDVAVADRYVELETETGTFVYDRRNHRAWLQSDVAIAVTECR